MRGKHSLSGEQAYLTPQKIRLSEKQWRTLRAEAEHLAPQEACGLLLGYCQTSYFQVVDVRPIKNILESPTRYQMNPEQQIQVFNEMEARNLQLVGIYHSHPGGPEYPSATDMDEAYYPEAVYIILSPNGADWQAQGFLIRENQSIPVKIEIVRAQT